MGVKGMQWFVDENQSSLLHRFQCKQVDEKAQRTPVVVDSWGLIYDLYASTLPWASGGEYLAFNRLVCQLVRAWRSVGLEPTFVFDGSSPEIKHDTALERLRGHNRAALEFWTTSVESRSHPKYRAKAQMILPPLTGQTVIHALRSLDVAVHCVASGEADGMCVAIANQLGGYVMGHDTDFLILISGVGAPNIRGFIPLYMLEWIEGDETPRDDQEAGDGWTSTGTPTPRDKQPRLLPAKGLVSPTLVVTSIAPEALRKRFRLAPQLFPLLAAITGNDYVNQYSEVLYPRLNHLQKIEAAATALRNAAAALSSKSADAGAQAYNLVEKTIGHLLQSRTLKPNEREEMVDRIIEVTFQYILPEVPGSLGGAYPFTAELDTRVKTDEEGVEKAREEYAALFSSGTGGYISHAYLFPGRIYAFSLLENPSGPAMRGSEGLRDIRTAAWTYLEQGCGGLEWPEPNPTEEEMTQLLEDRAAQKLLGGLSINDDTTSTSENDDQDDSIPGDRVDTEEERQAILEELCAQPRERTMVEWIRQGSSREVIAVKVPLPLADDSPSSPICLEDLNTRLQRYLSALKSDTDRIKGMPPHFQPLLALVRFSLLEYAARYPDTPYSGYKQVPELAKWGKWEVEAVLKVGLGMHKAWQNHPEGSTTDASKQLAWYPRLTNRSVMIVAQLNAVILDSILLAQSLLIRPTDRLPQSAEGGKEKKDKPLTHLLPFMFFSGLALHGALNRQDIPSITGYAWSNSDQDNTLLEDCVGAVLEGIEERVLDRRSSKAPSRKQERDTQAQALQDGPRGSEGTASISGTKGGGARNSKRSGRGGGGKAPQASGGSRFDLLNDLTA